MASRDEQLQMKQEDLAIVVEPLVDSISELVLSSVTGAFENVQGCCMDISDRTNKLVLIAQQVATSSTDVNLQNEVANCISDIAASIEKLVTSFVDLLSSNAPHTQQAFAAAAREVGEAINKLCSATDQTSQQKIMDAVKAAVASSKEVQDAAYLGKEKLLVAAQKNVDCTVRLVKVATMAAGATADEKKRKMLNDGAAKVKSGGPALIQAAKIVSEKPKDPAATKELNDKAAVLTEAYTSLINAAKLSPMYFGKMNETYEYVRKLIEQGRSLQQVASDLYTIATTGTNEQFVEQAKLVANKALEMAQHAEKAYEREKDPVKRVLIRDAIQELKDASHAYISAAQAYRQNPTAENKAKLDQAQARLDEAIRRIVQATGQDTSDQTPAGKLAVTSAALESAALRFVNAAKNNPKEMDIETLQAVAEQMAKDIEALAEKTSDPAEREKLRKHAKAIREATQGLIAAAKKVAANPNDKNAQRELDEAYKKLQELINQVRTDARLIEVPTDFSSASTDQLVNAAKEEAKAAIQLADEAEKLANNISDANKKQKLKAAIKDVKFHAGKVVENAELVRQNPHDPHAQEKLASSQKDLTNSIEKVISLTQSTDQTKEVTDAMRDFRLADSDTASKVLSSAQSVLDDIAKFFGNPNKKLSPQENIAAAKELSTKAAELAAQLREMAKQTQDPIYREKLLNSAKIIRDGSVQVKILSAVRAAGGEDSVNSVGNSAKVLQNNIQDIIKEIRAEELKHRFKKTVMQTIAINKVVKAWRKKA